MNKFTDGKKQNIVSPLAAWTKRRRFISRLSALDDRTLYDIGYRRSQIEEAAKMIYPRKSFKAYIEALMASIRQYLQLRRDERQLAAFDDRMLADIGLRRGEIPGALRGDMPFRAFSVPAIIVTPVADEARVEPVRATVGFAPTPTPVPVNDDEHTLAA